MVGGISRRAINKLGDAQVQAFVRKNKLGKSAQKKLFDGAGMYLTITSAGTPVWQQRYRLGGKDKTYAIGTLAEISLADARKLRDEARKLLSAGRDPVIERRLARAEATAASGQTFALLANEWLEKQKKGWSNVHYVKSKRALERDVLPRLGDLPVHAIKSMMVSLVVEAIVKRGARDTAAKVLQHVGSIFAFGQARGLIDSNPADPVHTVLPAPEKQRHHPALLTFPALGDVLRKAEVARLSPVVRMAHRLLAFSAARISNVVEAQWSEFQLEAEPPMWVIPRAQMKSKDKVHDHKTVLSPVIAAQLREWKRLGDGVGHVFPSPIGEDHITRESLEKAYRETLGLRGIHAPHGWRSAFSTTARDHGFDREVVELGLDHVHDNDVARAYDRGDRLDQRIKLMQWWGQQLDLAQRGGDVVPLRRSIQP